MTEEIQSWQRSEGQKGKCPWQSGCFPRHLDWAEEAIGRVALIPMNKNSNASRKRQRTFFVKIGRVLCTTWRRQPTSNLTGAWDSTGCRKVALALWQRNCEEYELSCPSKLHPLLNPFASPAALRSSKDEGRLLALWMDSDSHLLVLVRLPHWLHLH